MPSVFELLFDTYGDHLMQEQAPLDLAALQAALDPLELDPDARLEICDLLTDRYFRWGTAAFSIGLHLGLSLMQDCSGPVRGPDSLPCAAPQFMYPGTSIPGLPGCPVVLRFFRQRLVPFTARPAPGCW